MAYVSTGAKRGPPRWRYPTISNRSLKATTPGPIIIGLMFYYDFLCDISEGLFGCSEARCYYRYIKNYNRDASRMRGTTKARCDCDSAGTAFDYVMYNNKRGYLYIYWGIGARDIAP